LLTLFDGADGDTTLIKLKDLLQLEYSRII